VGLLGEVGHQLLEIAGDAADRRVARVELVLDPGQLVAEPCRQGLNRLVLRLLPQAFVPGEDGVNGIQE
jgi:hypothetical protein